MLDSPNNLWITLTGPKDILVHETNLDSVISLLNVLREPHPHYPHTFQEEKAFAWTFAWRRAFTGTIPHSL
jgi:hypothetical protein